MVIVQLEMNLVGFWKIFKVILEVWYRKTGKSSF